MMRWFMHTCTSEDEGYKDEASVFERMYENIYSH